MKPSFAFEVTPDDIWVIGVERGLQLTDTECDRLHDLLDTDEVARQALKGGTDMDDQTEAAYEEITRQLIEAKEWTAI